MTTPHRIASALAALLAGALAACASVPATLDPGAGHRELDLVAARGVQVYECRAAAGGAAWAFVAPDAELLDRRGGRIGHHGAGPHWTALDGSRIDGAVAARADAPRIDAIPWLLLRTRSAGGPGRWAGVTAIQRIHTEGGLAPAKGCSADRIGQRASVPYRADYRLYTNT